VSTWPTATIAAITSLSTLAGVVLVQRSQRRLKQEERREAALERAAAVVGPVRRLLSDGDPQRVSFNLGDRSVEQHEARWQEWTRLRGEMSTLSVAHPSVEVAAAFDAADVAVGNALHSSGWIVHDWAKGDRSERRETLDDARKEHAIAVESLARLLGLLRGQAIVSDGARRRSLPRRSS
jgi:hypothetical protein